MLVDINK